jgi:hypothetical protein
MLVASGRPHSSQMRTIASATRDLLVLVWPNSRASEGLACSPGIRGANRGWVRRQDKKEHIQRRTISWPGYAHDATSLRLPSPSPSRCSRPTSMRVPSTWLICWMTLGRSSRWLARRWRRRPAARWARRETSGRPVQRTVFRAIGNQPVVGARDVDRTTDLKPAALRTSVGGRAGFTARPVLAADEYLRG